MHSTPPQSTKPRCVVGLLEDLLGSIGEETEIRFPFYVDYGAHIRIGNDVQIGPNVQLLTATHPLEP